MKTLIVEICAGPLCHQGGANDLFEVIESLPTPKRERIDLRALVFFTGNKGPNVRINGANLSEVTAKHLLKVIDETLGYCNIETA